MDEDMQHIYSQAMTGSQIALSPICSQTSYVENNDVLQESNNLSEDESQCANNEYSFQIDSNPQQDSVDNNEETELDDSNKIEEIYEENRQLGATIAYSIENFEKCRADLSNELFNIESQLASLYEKHEQQLTQILNTQMKLEEDTDAYMKEFGNRPLLKDQAMHNHIITNVLKEHYDTVKRTVEESKTEIIDLKKELLLTTKFMEDLDEKFHNNCQNFSEESETLLSQITDLKNEIIYDTKIQVEKIEEGKLLMINNLKKIKQLESELSDCIEHKNQLHTSNNTLIAEIEEGKKDVAFLQEEIMNTKSKAAEELHQLELKKENQDNMLNNLSSILETKRNELSSLLNQEKEMRNINEQLKAGIIEVSERNRKLVEKNEEAVKKITSLNKQEEELFVQINELNYVEKHNESLKQNVNALKSSIHCKKLKIKEKKEKICLSEAKYNALKNILTEKQARVELKKKENNKLKIILDSKVSDLSITKKAMQEKKNALEVHLSEWQNKTKEIHDNATKTAAELQDTIKTIKLLNEEKININQQIDSIKKQIEHAEDKLKWKKKDLEFILESYSEIEKDEQEDLDKIEEELVGVIVELEEMSEIKAQKEALDLALQQQCKSWHEQRDRLVNDFTNTLKEKEREMEIYKTSFQDILDKEEKKGMKLYEQIRESELKKKKLESELKDLIRELKEAKEKETENRNSIVKLENALRSVTEAAKVTQQDIKQAITSPKHLKKRVNDDMLVHEEPKIVVKRSMGKSNASLKEKMQLKKLRTELTTPSSSLD